MLWLALGAFTLFLFLAGLRAFEQAPVTTIKSLLGWIGALGGLTLALLLVLTGRGGIVLGGAVMFGPLIWNRWRAARSPGVGAGSQRRAGNAPPRSRNAAMTRQEAYDVLGLPQGASEADIRAAYHRVMRTAHPDAGGSDWLAARVNMARDTLLSSRHA
jgi:hypothetical protein